MSALTKPVLRGHLKRAGIKTIIGGLLWGSINASLFFVFVKMRHEKTYEEEMRKYDPVAHANNLEKWGYYKTLKKD